MKDAHQVLQLSGESFEIVLKLSQEYLERFPLILVANSYGNHSIASLLFGNLLA
jgi:hypothetical protein